MPAAKIAVKQKTGETASGVLADQSLFHYFAAATALSGAAALVYQVLWVRQLGLLVGMEVYSITTAVSAFFAGLAAGGAAFGRKADHVASAIRLYVALEIAVAACAVSTTLTLPYAAMPFVWIQERVGPLAWVLPFLLVGGPAFLMGGALPVAVRALRADSSKTARDGGLLYASNTAGGIAGALVACFAFLPWFGVRGTALAAACLNITAAAVAWTLSKRQAESREREPKMPDPVVESRMALWLYAMAGAIALGYEVVWSQAITQFVGTRVFAFSIVLAVYLGGLAAGSWLGSRFALRVGDSSGLFGLLIACAGLVAMMEFGVLGPWVVETQSIVERTVLSSTGSQAMRMYAGFAMAGLGLVFLPTLLLGAAFPVALKLIVGARHVGADVGAVMAANLAGGIFGTLLTGFVLVPRLGLVGTLGGLAVGAAAVGVVAALSSGGGWALRLSVAAVSLAVAVAAFMTPANRLANLLLATRGGGVLVFYEEGQGATVAIAQQRSKDNVFRRLFIQGVSNSGDAMPSMRYMRLQAMLPVLIHDSEPKSLLVVGFGTGITAGETLRYPGLEKRVCAELLPAVVRSGEMFPENYKAWSDPRLEIRIRDGRHELMRSEQQYDVITLEPPPPSANGVANLYATEFYELARSRLAPKGLLAQWLPIATQNEGDTRSLVRSFLNVFPYATLWTTEVHEMLLVGSASPIRLDATRIASRFASGNVPASLLAVGVVSPAALLATWMMGREGLELFTGGAKPVTDDRPSIEYGGWVRPTEITTVLPHLLALKTEVPVENADVAVRAEIETRRTTLMDFYAAALAAYGGDRQGWLRAVQRVQSYEPKNAYYTWVIGRD